ncbi:hypothetical protein [Streptomyces sp. GS7]|uniref:hypothetical protein n=1 Tax=Streptomyces sp. GS7 TaxID=2692234 RepID=UPI001316A032|nr:hypothetical protein [Streptomyces sp. GS7]QHC24002.1 hypothetical protein GR130_24130 [Streptomyces sp. GS7]
MSTISIGEAVLLEITEDVTECLPVSPAGRPGITDRRESAGGPRGVSGDDRAVLAAPHAANR